MFNLPRTTLLIPTSFTDIYTCIKCTYKKENIKPTLVSEPTSKLTSFLNSVTNTLIELWKFYFFNFVTLRQHFNHTTSFS
jgi:hypothetical protein